MKLTKIEVMEQQRQASARNGQAHSARRARLILLLSDGLPHHPCLEHHRSCLIDVVWLRSPPRHE